MSGAADKARFYLEHCVPQLREFEEKKIFSREEIRTIVKKRSDFEHKVLARGSLPVNFARYAAYEINLEKLRSKRCKRLGIKGSSNHAGQARVFQILDRGVKRHPGDLGLWMTYLQYTKTSKALRKFKTVLTSALRMHPTKASLWLYAARSALELDSDMDGARSYMQRGTRFCPASRELWIEFAKLEMFYLAKISARRRILGLDKSRQIEPPKDVEQSAEEEVGFADDADEIRIPDFKQDTLQSGMMEGVKVDTDAAQDPMNTPALNGAIPIAIYDHVRKQPFFNMGVAEEFFDMFASFTQVHCVTKILQHVVDSMNDAQATDPSAANCYIRQPVAGVDVHTAEFPVALALALERLKQCQQTTTDIGQLSSKVTAWMEQLLAVNGLDEGIATVIQHTLRKLGQ